MSYEVHAFSVAAAMRIGLKQALLLEHIDEMCVYNADNGMHFHDGRYWMRASAGYFVKHYPYIPAATVKRILKRLVDDGYVVTGNFNDDAYDRTTWYSTTDAGVAVLNGSAK